MLCKKCGAQIHREDKRPDGLYQCPGCGAVYRPKQKADAAKAAETGQSAESAKAAESAKHTKGAKSAKHSKRAQGGGAKTSARSGRAARLRRNRLMLGGAIAGVAVIALVLALALGRGGGEDRKEAVAAAVEATEAATAEALAATPEPTATAGPTPTANPEVSVRIRAVGDVMAHKLQLSNALQKDGSYDFTPQFEFVKDALSKADYTIANLELSVSADGKYSSFPFFRTPEEMLAALKGAGVDLLTMANNHILDGFYDGLIKTLDTADALGFDRVGAYHTPQEAKEPLLVDINGIRFGFLAYTLSLNDNDKRNESKNARGCVKLLDGANFKADVQELRDQGAEVVVCLPHWGDEGRRSIAGSCKKYAEQMVDAGVDIILGSHPHVVLPIQCGEREVNGEKKDVLIAWSMGNFISYMAARYMDSGIIVDFTVTRGADGKISIHDVGYVPVYVCGSPKYFRLVCSGDFYNNRPDGMSDYDYDRMKQSVREIKGMIGEDGVTMLQN